MAQQYSSTSIHFSSIEPIEPGSMVCAKSHGDWRSCKVSNDGKSWTDPLRFKNLQAFERSMGSLKDEWRKVLLVNGEALMRYYKDAKNYPDVAYIVRPKKEFSMCPTNKPTLFEDNYIKDKFKKLRDKLPELEGIF